MKKFLISKNSKLLSALKKISKNGYKTLVVTGSNKKLLGTISDGDIRKALLKGALLSDSIKQVYNSDPKKLLVDKYPDGYDEDHIIEFRNAKNELVEAVEVTTEDTKYLVKVSTKLVKTMENYDEDDYEDFDNDDPDAIQDPDIEPSEEQDDDF